MKRADQLLQDQAALPSRTVAHRLITGGKVEAFLGENWQILRKPGLKLPEETPLRLLDRNDLQYVSRGGIKLAGALSHCGMTVRDHTVLDVGQSTGGFTDALLQAGAQRVVGIDVGRDQLRQELRLNPRVSCLEGVNARDLPAAMPPDQCPAGGFDRIVIDVSFISQRQILASVLSLAGSQAQLLALVKPQFEVGREHVGKGGIVRDPKLHQRVHESTISCYRSLGLQVLDYFDSPIPGGDGNREFFIFASRAR